MKHRRSNPFKSAEAEVVTTTGSTATVVLEGDESNKAGRRNSAKDQDMLQQMHDHSVALGADCGMMGKGSKTHKTLAELSASDVVKAIDVPLDVLVSAVREEFDDIRDDMRMAQKPFDKEKWDYWDWDDEDCPTCVAVYADQAIARIGLAHFSVPFTVENDGVLLAPQSEWTQVSQEWVTKTLPADYLKSIKIREVGAIKSLPGGRLGNYLVLWGDENRTDLTGEWFTKSTEGLTAIFDTIGKIPALYHHAMDGVVYIS